MRHAMTKTLVAVLAAGALAWPVATQSAKEPFSAEDILKVSSITVLDLSEDGRRVAVTARRAYDNPTVDNRRYGDPTYVSPSLETLLVIDTATGATEEPFDALVDVRRASWARTGDRLAILTVDPAAPLPSTSLFVWNTTNKKLIEVPRPAGATISLNSGLDWTPDGARVIVTLRTPDQDRGAQARFKLLTEGPIIVQDSTDPFLDWDALRRSDREREIAEINVWNDQRKTLLANRNVTGYELARDGSFLTVLQDVTPRTDYDVIGGTDNELLLVSPGSAPKTVVPSGELGDARLQWSDDGRTFAYAKKGEVFVQRIDEARPRSLTPKPPEEKKEAAATAGAPPADERKEKTESFSAGPFSRDGSKILVTSKKGWYVVNVADGTRQLVLALDENESRNPTYSAIAWSPDGQAIFVSYGARDRWDRGVMRLDLAAKTLTALVRNTRLYRGVQMSRDGSRFVFLRSDGDGPFELYATDSSFGTITQLTHQNDWTASRALPSSELVKYRDADGKELYGVLRYPIGYVKGQAYPTIFEIYETFFDNGLNPRAAFLTNHGYAVFHPSVNLVVGRPGEAWVKGVTAAANELIEMGVADPDRLGVHGTSYGGYATVLLITQTDRFKAAINISGKVDMVSFYTDSPRLGVRNTHAPEKSQDRLGGTLWEYPERYLEHSAVLHADRITTPLLCITGDQDPNVPASQSREIFYALRRLGKTVEWVRYVNGAHRPPDSIGESIDFENRILAWYDKYLKKDEKKTTNGR
jgi:dipeptidyl aminopeptidase/acylaminoacyl peptidase